MYELSSDSQFDFYLQEVLSLAQGGGANSGEVLRIATGILPHDFESTYTAFYYMAERVYAIAENISMTIDRPGKRDAYFRAATYYRGACFFILGNQSDPRIYSVFDQALESFDKAIALLDIPGQRFTVPTYSESVGNYDTIGVLYKAKPCNTRLPTIIVGSGYDGTQEEGYHAHCTQILARGINCVTYVSCGGQHQCSSSALKMQLGRSRAADNQSEAAQRLVSFTISALSIDKLRRVGLQQVKC
jgi:hypothetical protein